MLKGKHRFDDCRDTASCLTVTEIGFILKFVSDSKAAKKAVLTYGTEQ